jgi:hypothetical protein
MNKPLFITACILAFITILIYSFVASTIYKKTTCQNSPYYFCDTSWTCCTTGNPNCLASKSSTFDALKVLPSSLQSYKTADIFYGGKNPDGTTNNYQKYCIDPVNAMVAQYGSSGSALSVGCLYDGDEDSCSPQGVIDYMNTNNLLGKCSYSPFDQDGYYPGVGTQPGNWFNQATGYSSAYPQAYNGLDGTNTKPYSCFNSLYGGNNPSGPPGSKAYAQC